MPISEESNKISYNTDGLIREFSFNFKFLQPSNIKVSFWTKDDTDNSTKSVELEEGRDYTLIYDDAEEGGFVVLTESSAEEQAQGKPKYPATPTSGTLLVARIMPLDQQAHIRPVSGFPEEVITNTFDKLVMIDQQQQEQLDRCVKVSDVSDINPEVLVQQVERIHAGIEDIVVVADHIEDVEYVAANGEDILKASEDSLANVNAAKEQADIATEQAARAALYSQSCYDMLEDSREARDVAIEQAGVSTAQASVAAEQANIATEQANIVKEQKIIVEQLSQATNDIFLEAQSIEQKVSQDLEVSKGYAQTTLTQAGVATEQAGIAATQADIATARADEIKQYAANASISEANALNYASEASASAYNSEISERASATSATNSKIWAEGTDEEVQALGGVHSSKTWAEIGSNVGGKWGNILGDIKDQSDLQTALDSKANASDIPDLTNYVKNTDYATSSNHGIIKVDLATGISTDSTGKAYIFKATDSLVTAKTNNYRPLVPSNIDLVVKTGITTNTIELTDEEKESAKDWLGISGGGGYELFDVVLKDHILSYEETEGYELLGSYVYKEALAGSRYGYPDFYNKIIEEYNNATETKTVKHYQSINANIVGSLTESKGAISGFDTANYAQIPVLVSGMGYFEFQIKFKLTNNTVINTIISTSVTYDGLMLRINADGVLTAYVSSNGTSWNVMNGVKGSHIYQTDVDYWFKGNYNGNGIFTFSYSTNGKDFITDISGGTDGSLMYSATTLYNLGLDD